MNKTLTHIVACARNGVIGRDGDLPWHIPEDLKFFMQTTKGHCVIMGRKTFDSIDGKPLKNRLNLIVSRNPDLTMPEGAKLFSDIDSAITFAQEQTEWGDEIFICGGGELYRQTLDRADRVLRTLVDVELEGDATYPSLKDQPFKRIECRPSSHNDWQFTFEDFRRLPTTT